MVGWKGLKMVSYYSECSVRLMAPDWESCLVDLMAAGLEHPKTPGSVQQKVLGLAPLMDPGLVSYW